MTQRRITLVASNRSDRATGSSPVKCVLLPLPLPTLPSNLRRKLEQLGHRRPAALVVIERLVDDLLARASVLVFFFTEVS